jgi:hypothetical protein
MTLLDDIDDELAVDSWNLRRIVPGYDYRTRDSGVETDRQIREKLGRDLRTAASTLDDVSDVLYRRGERDRIERVDELHADVERVRQRITTAPAGGGSTRDLAVDEQEALVVLVEYDAKLVEGVQEVLDGADRIREAVDADEVIEPHVRECGAAVDDLDRAFTGRQEHMDGLRA